MLEFDLMNSEYRDQCIILQLRGASVYRRRDPTLG